MKKPDEMSLKQLKVFAKDVSSAITAIEDNNATDANRLIKKLMDNYGIRVSEIIDNRPKTK